MKQTELLLRELEAEFLEHAIDPNGLFLLDSNIAIQFILTGVQKGLELQGVESFRITREGAFQPEQEFSNDIADQSVSHEDFVDMTINLVKKGGRCGVKFQVVFALDIK